MSDKTLIEWSDATWNPITGCSVHSPGCTNCYAMLLAGTRLSGHPSRAGLTRQVNGNHVWTGEVRFNEQWLDQPLRWSKPRMIFVCAHGDLFHESVPYEWIDRVFAVMALAPQHNFQVLTKRPARMREYMANFLAGRRSVVMAGKGLAVPGKLADVLSGTRKSSPACAPMWCLPNVWLGVSVEDQARADERREDLRNTPAAVRFVSYEPALGPVDWAGWEFIDQLISGGESGPKARPNHPDWHRAARDFCAPHGIAYFFKQWGDWFPVGWEHADSQWHVTRHGKLVPKADCDANRDFPGQGLIAIERRGKKRAGRLLDGVEHNGFPA